MTNLQEKLLGLLKELDILCRENDIEYYLVAGSLLGAIRHRGFIPWDDDVDVIMSRSNWEKFLERTRGKLPEGRVINTQYDNVDLAMTINRYSDINTAAIYRFEVSNPEQTGVMIDILIMDPLPDNTTAKEKYITALTEHTELTNLCYQYSLRIGKSTHFTHNWNKSKRRGKRAVLDEIDKVAFSYDESTSDFYAQRFVGSPHIWPKEYFGKPKYVPFEDTMLPVPERAEDCLAIGFDEEWMMVPEAGPLKSSHDFCVQSLSVPAENITSEFWKLENYKTVQKSYVRKKKNWEHITEGRLYQACERDRFVAARLQMIYSKKKKEENFRVYLTNGDYEALGRYFEEYISMQCNSRCLGSSSLTGWLNWYRKCWPFLIDIGDEELYAVLLLAFHMQRLAWVVGLLKARKVLERPMTEELLAVDRLNDAVREAQSHFYCHEWDECRLIVDEYLPLWPDNPYLYKLDIKLKLEEGYTANSLVEAIEAGLDLFPEDPELCYLKAYGFFESGKAEDALLIYQELVKTTNHGLILMHMQDKMEQLIEENPLAKGYYALWLKIRKKRGETELPKLDDLCSSSMVPKSLQIITMNKEVDYRKASDLFAIGQTEDALHIYQDIVKTTSQDDVLSHMQNKMEQLIEENPLARDYYALWLEIRKKRGEMALPKLDTLCPLSMGSKRLQITVMRDVAENYVNIPVETKDPLAHLTGVQRKRFELLVDLDNLCQKNEIEYFLLSKGLWMAVRTQKYTDSNADIVVAMTPENCRKFVDAVDAANNPSRYVDSMETNPFFHRIAIRYCDRNSLDMTISKCIAGGVCENLFGVYITIEILRSPAEKNWHDKFRQMIEIGWEATIGGTCNSKLQRAGKRLLNVSCILLSRKRSAKMVYRFLIHEPKKADKENCYIKIYGKGRELYPKDYFYFTKQVVLEGYKFSTIKKADEYLTAKFGANWSKKLPNTKVTPTARLVDEEITGQDFVAYLDNHGIDRKAYLKNFRKTESRYFRISTLNKETDCYWSLMCACGEHYRLYDQYMPKKGKILELYQKDNVKQLNKVLDDYIKTAIFYAKKGMNIEFDAQITMVMDYVLYQTKREKQLVLLNSIRKQNPMPPINGNYKIK